MGKQPRSIIIILTLVLCSVSVSYSNGATAKAPAIDPQAEQILRQMSDYLSSLQGFSVHVDAVVEGVTPSGQRLDTDRYGDVWMERPNKLLVNMISAHHNVQMYYDGNTFTIFSPRLNYYATWSAPGTIDELVVVARKKYGLVLPGADLLSSDPYSKMIANVKSGTYVGESPVREVMTHQLAFRQPDIDWQIWIAEGDTPLPMRIIITDKRTSGQPQYMASYSDWNTSPVFDPYTFVFMPPAGAQKIDMRTLPTVKRQATPKKGGSK
ncbi:MAG: DUF2092 domain-containing protein [Armatimonadota bacterium]|nr:DUF2092 domain-containing protein [bacterium]